MMSKQTKQADEITKALLQLVTQTIPNVNSNTSEQSTALYQQRIGDVLKLVIKILNSRITSDTNNQDPILLSEMMKKQRM